MNNEDIDFLNNMDGHKCLKSVFESNIKYYHDINHQLYNIGFKLVPDSELKKALSDPNCFKDEKSYYITKGFEILKNVYKQNVVRHRWQHYGNGKKSNIYKRLACINTFRKSHNERPIHHVYLDDLRENPYDKDNPLNELYTQYKNIKKGIHGEKLVCKQLKFICDYLSRKDNTFRYHIIPNVTLNYDYRDYDNHNNPIYHNNGINQIDIILVSSYGIFVFEVKNYSIQNIKVDKYGKVYDDDTHQLYTSPYQQNENKQIAYHYWAIKDNLRKFPDDPLININDVIYHNIHGFLVFTNSKSVGLHYSNKKYYHRPYCITLLRELPHRIISRWNKKCFDHEEQVDKLCEYIKSCNNNYNGKYENPDQDFPGYIFSKDDNYIDRLKKLLKYDRIINHNYNNLPSKYHE